MRPSGRGRNGNGRKGANCVVAVDRIELCRGVGRGTELGRGYRRKWFDDAFARYLPQPSVTTSQSSVSAGFADPRPVTRRGAVTDGNGQEERNSAACDGVTDWTGPPDVEPAGRGKFVYRPLPSGWLQRRMQEFHEYRDELRRRGLPEEDSWCYSDGVGAGLPEDRWCYPDGVGIGR